MSKKRNSLGKIYRASNNQIISRGGCHSDAQMRGCLSKVGYDTEFEAEVSAAERGLRAYKCLYCPHYHLTSQGTAKEKKK